MPEIHVRAAYHARARARAVIDAGVAFFLGRGSTCAHACVYARGSFRVYFDEHGTEAIDASISRDIEHLKTQAWIRSVDSGESTSKADASHAQV